MKKLLIFLSLFAVALVISTSSCKRGQSIVAVGYPDTADFPVFDTFDFPTAKYYFYGKFDGKYKMWQDAERSKWDTITRFGPEPKWSDRTEYLDNIYFNFTNIKEVAECGPDSNDSYLENKTYFIRPEDPYQRLEIYFYDCVDLLDTNNINWPNNELSVFLNGANPFTNIEYGRNGVRVVYVDENLDKWETLEGSGQTIDTYFRITDFYPRNLLTDTLDTFGMYIVEGEFAGRLYNGTKEKTVLDAKFKTRVIPREPF